jgi:hypothetical protein
VGSAGSGEPGAAGRRHPRGADVTKRIRLLWATGVVAATTAAVLTTPAITAGITFNVID